MATISGTVKDSSNNFAQRLVRAYRRNDGAYAEQCCVSVLQSIDALRMLTKTPELSIKPVISRRASDKVRRSSVKREKSVAPPRVMQVENTVRAMTGEKSISVTTGVQESYVIVNTRENSVFVVESNEL